jgi:phage host-nuclease inhibitor protein Gam
MSENAHLDTEVAKIESDALPIAKAAASYQIVDQETLEHGINFLGKVKAAFDRVEQTRKFFTAPLLDLKKKYDAKFKPVLDELESAEKALKATMKDYRLTLPENAPTTSKTADAKATFVKVWKHRIVDASKVPAEYLTVDEKKIAKVVTAGLRNIPGVEIYETEEVRGSYAG